MQRQDVMEPPVRFLFGIRGRAIRLPRRDGLSFPGHYLVLGLIVALGAAVRCSTLSFQSLWLDEVATVVEAGRSWPELLLALFDPRQGYPLYILGMRLWIAVWGTGEAALRWPSALAGTLSVPLLYLLGRRLLGRRVGLLAAALLAVSPLAVWYSQEAKAYALFMLLTLSSWLLLWEAVERRAGRLWWALAGVSILALLLHRLAVLSVIGQLVYVLYIARQGGFTRRHRLLLMALLVVVLLLTLAGLWFALGQEGAGRQFGSARDPLVLLHTFSQFSLRTAATSPEPALGPDRRHWLLPFALAGLLGLAMLGRELAARGRRRRSAVFLLCFLFVPLGAFFLLYLLRPFYYERYLLGTLPAYMLLLAVGLVGLGRWAGRLLAPSRRGATGFAFGTSVRKGSGGRESGPGPGSIRAGGRVLLAAALGLVAVATAVFILAASWRQVQDWTLARRPSKEQFREATRYLQQHLHPGDLVIVHPGYIRPAVDYYQQGLARVPVETQALPDLGGGAYGFREFEAAIEALARGHRRAWLYLAPFHAPVQDPRNWVYEWFYLNPFLHCDEQHYIGLDLYCVSFNVERGSNAFGPTIPLAERFGREVLLTGADLGRFYPEACQSPPSVALPSCREDGPGLFCRPLEAGDPLAVTLYAQGLRADLPDIEAQVRLIDAAGRVWSATSGRPLGGYLPTSLWAPGDEFMDYHVLLLPEAMPAGRYQVQASYRLSVGELLGRVLDLLPERCRAPAGRGLVAGGCLLPRPDGSFWATLGTVEVRSGGRP